MPIPNISKYQENAIHDLLNILGYPHARGTLNRDFLTNPGMKKVIAYIEFFGLHRNVKKKTMEVSNDAFCSSLATKGNLYVVRFDNRDIGLSSYYDHLGAPNLLRSILKKTFCFCCGPPSSPYSLSDMADDVFGLMDHLSISKAHLAGASMGGMIAQTCAIDRPERVLSLCSIMSTTGQSFLPRADSSLLGVIFAKPKKGSTREETAENLHKHFHKILKALMNPVPPEDTLAQYIETTVKRSYHPEGGARQLAAILNQVDRRPELGKLKMPCLVVHGRGDRLVKWQHGTATAKAIGQRCNTLFIDFMGHSLPRQHFGVIVDAIVANVARAEDVDVDADADAVGVDDLHVKMD